MVDSNGFCCLVPELQVKTYQDMAKSELLGDFCGLWVICKTDILLDYKIYIYMYEIY